MTGKVHTMAHVWPRTVTTQVLVADDPHVISKAAEAVLRGDLIILPTDTVYGVGAMAFDGRAIESLYVAKQRSRDKGIPILIADVTDLDKLVTGITPHAAALIERFWPGPLTLVLPRRSDLPEPIGPGDSVAVRMPDYDLTRSLIRAAGGALAATSANLSGRPPALTVNMALQDLAGSVAVAVDAGPSRGEQASTVVDCTGDELRILRAGPLSMSDLAPAET
jgi:L-threonylcarbamoyladenylate synthase